MDDDLIDRAQKGDRTAFGMLMERHYDFVHAVAWRWSGNVSDAEDIAQTVCLKLASAIRGFRGASRFRTWLYTLTLNAARDHQRSQSRERRKAASFLADPTSSAANDNHDQTEALWEAVRQLPDKQGDAVLLVYGEGLSHSAAADVMGCSEATVSWHVHEARKRLKILLGRETM
ncbi:MULTISPECIES: RNA polymerase sigma factor [unclassified Rhizobium]|uniref:RNA polymerase sigma factor n=1 Tax=unclassified Rhizobium TaxID=2613769 RepID=UPI000714D202|nr:MULTISPECIES: sigma-70 family RNA polymerase sigma factor [unclassified Rhizobium]KQT00282.1 RNA polymerase subunit sigma-70 [Rhizobium sp. Leaf391]KQT97286.1 RNA polymerase subunit sigma-70 [Rhizobium sp. Leaf453]